VGFKSLGTRKHQLARMMSSSLSQGSSNGPKKDTMASIEVARPTKQADYMSHRSIPVLMAELVSPSFLISISAAAYRSQEIEIANQGKSDWNIPKHLARFDWEELPDKSLTVRVYPHDTSGDKTEATASSTPFFQATMKPVPFVPSIPFSSEWLSFVGMNLHSVHPPLPEGRGSQGELPGTSSWCVFTPTFSGKALSLVTVDMAQFRDDDELVARRNKNFWPGLSRWRVGILMENATLVLDSKDI
jgi:hypothetical protein